MMRRSMWLGLGLLALLLGAFMIWAFHETFDVQVLTAPVTTGAIDRRIVATGTLEAVTNVQVGTQVSGVIQTLDVDYNSMVRAGQVLARLDPASYEAELLAAQAALAKARDDALGLTTEVEDARTKLVRAEQLFTRQIIAQSDLDAARIADALATADLKAEESQIVVAEAAVHEAGLNLEHTIIRSPIDGIVVARNVAAGQTLAASLQSPVLFSIAADLTRMQVQVDVDESDVGGLSAGERATFDVESYPDQTFHGTVSEVRLEPLLEQTAMAAATASSFANTGVAGTLVSYTAIVDVANPDERLRPGMTALVVISGSRRDNVIRIPNSALSFRPPPEVLDVIGKEGMPAAGMAPGRQDGSGGAGAVWRYDGRQFTPIAVVTGLANEGWTELVSGAVHSGDPLVTSASVRRQSRLSALAIRRPE